MVLLKNVNRISGEQLVKEDKELKSGKAISCSECGMNNDKNNKYCIHCGHKLKKINKRDKSYREYCPICKDIITNDMEYCGKHGHKIERNKKKKKCPICGEWCGLNRYCINCGHDFYTSLGAKNARPIHYGDLNKKKCPNCNKDHSLNYNYCEYCGTKLIKNDDILNKIDNFLDRFVNEV